MTAKRQSNSSVQTEGKVSRRKFIQRAGMLAGTAVLGGVAAACTPQPAPAATATPAAPAAATATPVPAATAAPAVIVPKYGGRLTWAIEQDPANLVPFGSVGGPNHWGKEHIYESLALWDRDLNIVPGLATSWETPDDRTWVFHLRQGVKFHNGDEVTAEDVKYSFEMQKTPPPPGQTVPATAGNIDFVEVVDKYTAKFHMSQPDPTVLGYLGWGRYSPVIPKDAYDRWNLVSEGIGTNMFKLVRYVANDRVEYVKFDDYWNPDLPHLDELVIKVLPDESSRVAALRAGEIDGCFLLADSAAILERDPDIEILKGLYSAPSVLQFTLKNEGKPWEDVRVRQAMSKAINRDVIIDNVWGGAAEYSAIVPPGYGDWYIPPDELKAKWHKFDLDEARRLMKEAGYEDGFEITLHAIANHPASQTAEVVKEQLKALNIEVTVLSEEIGTFAQRVGEGNFEWCSTHRGMRHDITGYVVDFCRTDFGTYAKWFNDGEGYYNEESARLYEKLLVTLDQEERKKMARQIQEIVLDEVPHIYVCQGMWFHGVRKHVRDMYASYTQFYPGLRTAWLDK